MSLKIKKLNIIKILLDIAMVVLLVLMYNAKVISLNFHELGGLIVCSLFLVHKLLNWKWIGAVSKKIFRRDLKFKTKFGYIIDFLLVISVTAILVSGIMISKVLFRNVSNNNFSWQMIHYFASAVSLVLVGIHVGLHWNFVMGMFRKFVKIPKTIAKPLSIILAIAVILFGSYSVSTSGFTRWITAPFSASQNVNFEGRQRPSDFNFDNNTPAKGEGQTVRSNLTKPQMKGGRLDKGGFPNKQHEGGADPLGVIVTFTSIIGVFAAVTYYIEKLLKRVMLQNIHN